MATQMPIEQDYQRFIEGLKNGDADITDIYLPDDMDVELSLIHI